MMAGAQPTQKIEGSKEHKPEQVPYMHNDTQDEKLRKVRAELLETIRIHDHEETTNSIVSLASEVSKLRDEIAFLKSVITKVISQAPAEQNTQTNEYISTIEALKLLKEKGVKRATRQTLYNTLVMLGYMQSHGQGYKLTRKGETVIRKTRASEQSHYTTYEYKLSFVLEIVVSGMLKIEEALA